MERIPIEDVATDVARCLEDVVLPSLPNADSYATSLWKEREFDCA